jgi:hypothetical protein
VTIEEFNEVSVSAAKRAWARLIKQVYEVDPLTCPRRTGPKRIIAFIEHPEGSGFSWGTHLSDWSSKQYARKSHVPYVTSHSAARRSPSTRGSPPGVEVEYPARRMLLSRATRDEHARTRWSGSVIRPSQASEQDLHFVQARRWRGGVGRLVARGLLLNWRAGGAAPMLWDHCNEVE